MKKLNHTEQLNLDSSGNKYKILNHFINELVQETNINLSLEKKEKIYDFFFCTPYR